MSTKDLLKSFKAAAWASPDEIEAFVVAESPAPPAELQKALAMLLDRRLMARPLEHRSRCIAFQGIAERSLSPELFPHYARALREADTALITILTQLLPRVNNVDGHAELCQVAGDERSEAREAALKVLVQIIGPRSLETLERLVPLDSFAGRAEVLDAVVPKALHRALPLLAAVARSGSPRERAHAIKTAANKKLFAKDVAGATQVIVFGLSDAHEQVVAQACKALATFVEEDEFWTLAGHLAESKNASVGRAFLEAVRSYGSERVLAFLAKTMRTGAIALRIAAIESLHGIGTEAVLPLLTEALQEKNVALKTRAAEALADLSKSGRVELARTIVWLLRSRDVDVRRIAVELARQVGDPSGELVPKLLRLLRDEDWWVRERVMDALVEISGKRLTTHVLKLLADPSEVVRRFAVGALRRIKDPRSAASLARVAMGDPDWWVREEAVNVLAELGDPRVVPYLIKLLAREADLHYATIKALHKLRAKDAADEVAAVMGTGDAGVRLACAELLADLGGRSHAEWLIARGDDADARVRLVVDELQLRYSLAKSDNLTSITAAADALDRLLIEVHRRGADDLLVGAGRPPYVKRMGQVTPIAEEPLSHDDVERMLSRVLSPVQRRELRERREVDCSYQLKSHDLRFRVNGFLQMGGMSAVFRLVRNVIPNIDTLGLPPIVKTFGELRNGLVLVGGPTGAGKSTTLAALIDFINRTSARHIVTIEDPIEVVHDLKMSLMNQRESGTHTASFARALKSTLRQDPDVILVGELRDHETISFAVTAAETGHLVFGTVHTVSADTSIDRILHVFPPTQRAQVRAMLSESLRAVVCQYLLRRKDRPNERVLASEVMINNDAIANLIRKDKSYQISAVVATSREAGMQQMDASLASLVKQGIVDPFDAYVRAVDKKLFEPKSDETVKGAAGPSGPNGPHPAGAAGAGARGAVRAVG